MDRPRYHPTSLDGDLVYGWSPLFLQAQVVLFRTKARRLMGPRAEGGPRYWTSPSGWKENWKKGGRGAGRWCFGHAHERFSRIIVSHCGPCVAMVTAVLLPRTECV